MKNLLKSTLSWLATVALLLPFISCRDDLLFGEGNHYDGEVSLDLDFEFEAMGEVANTRALAGNLDFGINQLTIFFYDAKNNETAAPVKTVVLSNSDFKYYTLEERPETHCEEKTYHGKVKIDGIEAGSYRIYAAANVNFDSPTTLSEKELRETRIVWPAGVVENPGTDSPSSNGVPDAMFGFFTTSGVTDHTAKKYRDVIHHNPVLYDKTTEPNDKGKTDNRAPVVTLDREHMEMQAWLKRVVSKVTIGYDGSALNSGIEIYIKSVAIKDAASSCFLGHDNSVGTEFKDVDGEAVTLLDNQTYARDARFFLEYSSEPEAAGVALTKATPAFPRESLANDINPVRNDADGNGWNDTWYEAIHGSWANPNPKYNSQPTTLYFLENLQGVKDGQPKKDSNKDTDGNFTKDVPNGTYIEVKAYYRSKNPGEKSGNITYRFMLGKNVTNDFNAERNHHYKLTLSFIGDANDPDWHIEIEEPKRDEGYYFRIPYNIADDASDINFSDEVYREDWFRNENWKPSYVWYAYDENHRPIAEIVKELVYYDYYNYKYRDPRNATELKSQGDVKLRKFYQVVTVYPICYSSTGVGNSRGETNYGKGIIAQVLECDSETPGKTYMTKTGGASIAMANHDDINSNVNENYGYRGDCAIVSCELTPEIAAGESSDSHAGYFYVKYTPNAAEQNTQLELIEAPLQTRLETRPWLVKDNVADNNLYPIVKIGASYWFRENLRAKHYSYPETSPLEAYRPEVGSKADSDCVYMHDNARMYKTDKTGALLYNLAAICGTEDNDPWIEYDKNTSHTFFINQRGTDYLDGDVIWLQDNEIDWQITPQDWHIPTAKMYWEQGAFWETHVDNQYVMDYVSDNLARCMVNKGGYNWPSFPDVTVPNLSGLSLVAIPADGSSTVSFNLSEDAVSKGNLAGVCVPYWTDVLYEYTKEKPTLFYANPPFMGLSDKAYYVTSTVITSLQESDNFGGYYKEISKQYLPVRPVRHAALRYPAQWSDMNSRWNPVPQK